MNNLVCFKEIASTLSNIKAPNHKNITIFFLKHSTVAQLSDKSQMKSQNRSERQKPLLALYRQQQATVFHPLNIQRMHTSVSPYDSYSFVLKGVWIYCFFVEGMLYCFPVSSGMTPHSSMVIVSLQFKKTPWPFTVGWDLVLWLNEQDNLQEKASSSLPAHKRLSCWKGEQKLQLLKAAAEGGHWGMQP